MRRTHSSPSTAGRKEDDEKERKEKGSILAAAPLMDGSRTTSHVDETAARNASPSAALLEA
jgi:hypothetical protein